MSKLKSLKNNKKNIIVFLLDTVRQADINAMQYTAALARAGTSYLNAISPGTWTIPSHASIFTNKNVTHLRNLPKDFFHSFKNIDPWLVKTNFLGNNEITLASKLKIDGYTNILFSSNPLISSQSNITTGFDKVYDIWNDSIIHNSLKIKMLMKIFDINGRMNVFRAVKLVSLFIPGSALDSIYLSLRIKGINSMIKRDGTFNIDRGGRSINKNLERYLKYDYDFKPHFMFMNFMEAHENYPVEGVLQDKWLYLSGVEDLSEYVLNKLHNAYIRRIKYMDRKIINGIEILRKYGLLDNTKIIITSDHGQLFGEHGLLYHGLAPYHNEVNVPLIELNYENGKIIDNGRKIITPVSIKDLYSNILYNKPLAISQPKAVISEHLGIADGWDESLLNMLKQRSNIASIIYRTKHMHNHKATAIYKGNMKLIHFFGRKKDELYNILDDSIEMDNIIDKNRFTANNILNAINY